MQPTITMSESYKKIILAEDDDDDVDFFKGALSECRDDFNLLVAKNGNELDHILKQHPSPYAIVLDLNMPLVSGKESLVKIRSQNAFDRIPVIILSTSNDIKDKQFCLLNGATDYLVKPGTYNGLKEMILKLCNGGYSSQENNKKQGSN
jgi:DNA-binding response OmpR family regulator